MKLERKNMMLFKFDDIATARLRLAAKAEDEEATAEEALNEDVLVKLFGYGSTYEDPTNPDSWGDIFAKGAFDEFIADFNEGGGVLPMMDNHGVPVGAWKVIEDDPDAIHGKSGLWMEGEVYDAYTGPDLAKLIKKQVIKGLSVGVYIHESSYLEDHTDQFGWPVRKILKASLGETSPTPFPANNNASIEEWKSAMMTKAGISRHGKTNPRAAAKGCGCGSSKADAEKGSALADTLNAAIDSMVDDDTSRGEIIASMGAAAGIGAPTVNQILNESIDCPPMARLQGFARALGVSMSSLISAAEEDGCAMMSDDEDDSSEASAKSAQTKGAALAELLNGSIDSMVDGENGRDSIIAMIADSIEPGDDLNGMLAGADACPTMDQLKRLASALPLTLGWLMAAAEEDGCMFGDDEDDAEEDAEDLADDEAESEEDAAELEEASKSLGDSLSAFLAVMRK